MTAAGPRATWTHTAGMTVPLAMLVATIFVVPVAAPPLGDSGRAVIALFSLLVLLAGAWAIAEHQRAARVLAIGEALVGQLYPAIILARLVTRRRPGRRRRRPRPDEARVRSCARGPSRTARAARV